MTQAQVSLLTKGLKFVPTRRKVDIGILISDLTDWERRMCFREYFYNENEKGEEEEDLEYDKHKKKRDFTPSSGREK